MTDFLTPGTRVRIESADIFDGRKGKVEYVEANSKMPYSIRLDRYMGHPEKTVPFDIHEVKEDK